MTMGGVLAVGGSGNFTGVSASEMVRTLASTDGAWLPPSNRSRSPGWIARTAADRLTVTGVASTETGTGVEVRFHSDAAAAA